jgi:hypothetical protein
MQQPPMRDEYFIPKNKNSHIPTLSTGRRLQKKGLSYPGMSGKLAASGPDYLDCIV